MSGGVFGGAVGAEAPAVAVMHWYAGMLGVLLLWVGGFAVWDKVVDLLMPDTDKEGD